MKGVICPECGPVDKCDEDGCCLMCGEALFADENGEPTIQTPEVYEALGWKGEALEHVKRLAAEKASKQ